MKITHKQCNMTILPHRSYSRSLTRLSKTRKKQYKQVFDQNNQKTFYFGLKLQNKDYLCRHLIKNKKKDASAISIKTLGHLRDKGLWASNYDKDTREHENIVINDSFGTKTPQSAVIYGANAVAKASCWRICILCDIS